LVIVLSLPKFCQSWSQYIVDSFDINICKCSLSIDDGTNDGSVKVTDLTYASIMAGEFSYEVQPCKPFLVHVKRIYKYIGKGFMLKSITFHPMCSKDYIAYVMGRFHNMKSTELALPILQSMGMSDSLQRDMLEENIRPFLANPKKPILEQLRVLQMCERDRADIAATMYSPNDEPSGRFSRCLYRENKDIRKKQLLLWIKMYWLKKSNEVTSRKRKRDTDSANR
jgi:hypothetical protein